MSTDFLKDKLGEMYTYLPAADKAEESKTAEQAPPTKDAEAAPESKKVTCRR